MSTGSTSLTNDGTESAGNAAEVQAIAQHQTRQYERITAGVSVGIVAGGPFGSKSLIDRVRPLNRIFGTRTSITTRIYRYCTDQKRQLLAEHDDQSSIGNFPSPRIVGITSREVTAKHESSVEAKLDVDI